MREQTVVYIYIYCFLERRTRVVHICRVVPGESIMCVACWLYKEPGQKCNKKNKRVLTFYTNVLETNPVYIRIRVRVSQSKTLQLF